MKIFLKIALFITGVFARASSRFWGWFGHSVVALSIDLNHDIYKCYWKKYPRED